MINEYKKQCGYDIGTLKPYIYVIPKNEMLCSYKIDNNKIDVVNIKSDRIYKIYGNNVILTSEETIDNRFKFNSTITMNIVEMMNEPWFQSLNILRNTFCFVIVENLEGNQFIQSVEFPSEFTYEYSFSNSETTPNTCELTFKCNSNIPTLLLSENVKEKEILVDEQCNYNIGKNTELRICDFKSTYLRKSSDNVFNTIYTNGDATYELVECDENSFNFNETYNGTKFTSTLTFTISLSKYKYIFHYNLIEFKKNRYTVVFKTLNDIVIAAGFEFGFFPSYTITTSEDYATPNTITITLKHEGNQPLLYNNYPVNFVIDTSTVRTPVVSIKNPNNETINTILCLDDTRGIYTLVQEYTKTGQPLNRYWCYEGYEARYYFLNIVGTYSANDEYGKSLIFNSETCAKQQNCQIIKGLPQQMIFEENGQKHTYTLLSTCDWVLTNIPSFIGVSVSSGKGNEEVEVTFTALAEPTSTGSTGIGLMTSGSDSRQCQFILQRISDWISPLSISCNAKAQTVYSYLLNGTVSTDVTISDADGTNVSFKQNEINIAIPANESETNMKTYNVTFSNNKLNQTKTVVIIQDKIYVEWKWLSESAYICSGRNSYKELTKFIGYEANNITIQTGETKAGELIKENDARCVSTNTKWVDTDRTTCSGATKYVLQEEWVSYDYGETYEKTGETRPGSVIEYNSPDCSSQYTWVYENNNICLDGNLYKQYVKYYNDGTSLKPTGETKLGEVIEIQSPECMSDEENVIQYTFSYDTLITNTNLTNLKIASDTAFVVNWGDGTTNNYLVDNYKELATVSHTWANAGTNTKKSYTVVISGGIRELRLEYPEQYQASGLYYTDFNIDKGINLNKFYVEHTKISKVNLTHNRSLLDFEMIDNYHVSGLREFTLPQSIQLQYIHIGNQESSDLSYITAEQLQSILDSLPQYDGLKRGLVDFCWNTASDNVNQTCGLDYSALDTKNWFKSLPCCANVGNIRYQRVPSDETRCGDDYDLWICTKLQQSVWEIGESGTGRWGDWTDVVPYTYFLDKVIKKNSTQCGYEPTEKFKWEGISETQCDGLNSYYMEQKMVSYDDGVSWNPVDPPEKRMTDNIAVENDPNCGYLPPEQAIYKWEEVIGEYLCDEEDTNCIIDNQWIPIGFEWNDSKNGGVFRDKTITNIPTVCDGKRINNADNLFAGLQLVKEFPLFDTSNVGTMNSMFENCISMTAYPYYTTNECKSMKRLFSGCSKLTTVNFNGTENVTNMEYMFTGCKKLAIVRGIDLMRCFNINYMFDSTSTQYNDLVTVEIKNCNVDLDMKTCFKVSHDSLVYIIENSIGSFNWYIPKSRADLLTSDETAKAASKGINIVVN